MKMRRWGRAVPFVLLSVAASVVAATSPTVRYASASDEFRVEQEEKSDGRTVTYVGTGDSMLGSEDTCKPGPDFACIDLSGAGNTLRLMVLRDLERRISATVSAMEAARNRQAMERLRWSDGDFDYRVEPRGRVPNNHPVVWEHIRFFGTEIDAVMVFVYRSGQADSRRLAATFPYNPEHGVLALDYPFGGENGETVFKSFWLEGKCGLILIEPCHERQTR